MQRRHLHLLAALIVAVIFSFTTAWEFVLEDWLIHGFVTHGEVSQAHKWEFIGAATIGAIIAAGIFNLIGLRIFADRDNADERYHRVVDLCPEAMWVNVDQKLVFANAAYIRQMRANSLDDLIGKSALEFIHPDSRDRYNTLREAFLTGQGQIQSEEVKRRRLDGTEYIGEYSVGHTIWNGKPAVQVVCRDITERKQSTEALLQSEMRFRGLIDIATDAVISIDLQGNIQLFNQGAEKIFGHNTEDILGKPLDLLLPERFRSGHGHHLKQFVQSPETSRLMNGRDGIYGMRKDGSEFPAEASISKLALPTGIVLTVMLRDITERHLAEEKLQESEARYRRVVTLSPDATFIQSDYKLVFANDAFLRQVGAGSLNEVIGIPLIDFVHPDHRDKVSARRENMFASDEPIAPVEVKRLRLDGSEYYAEIAAARLTWEGKPAAQVVCRDITDRKRVEDKLRESEQRYRGVVDMSPEAAIVYVDRRLVFANQAFLDQVGASSLDKVLGKLSEDFIHLGDREASQARREEMLISNQPIGLTEIRRLRLDGTEYPAEVAATQLLWNGKPAIQLVCRDITDRHIAEEKLLESEARYRRVVTLSPDATFIQLDYKLVFANDAFLRQVGAGSLDEVIGKSLYDFIHPDEREKVSARRKNMFASDEPIAPVEVKRLRLDGSEYYAEIAAARLTWDGKPAAQVVCRDITERKKIESALQAAMDDAELASRAKSEFLAGMSHELRTPLNAIIGFSDIMKKEALGPVGSPRYREYAGDIHSSGEHLLALINDILDISKIEAGEGELHEDNVDLADIVRSCATMIKERAHKGGIALMTDGIDGTVPSLRADPRRLKQILINLMSNAVKFTEAGGTVTIKVWHNPVSGHVIQCIDTGIGIAVDDIPKALAQFQQVDGTLSREQEGTGLGLPLTKSLVELHGGTLDLQSEIDKGTTVTVKLPVDRTVSSDGIAQSA